MPWPPSPHIGATTGPLISPGIAPPTPPASNSHPHHDHRNRRPRGERERGLTDPYPSVNPRQENTCDYTFHPPHTSRRRRSHRRPHSDQRNHAHRLLLRSMTTPNTPPRPYEVRTHIDSLLARLTPTNVSVTPHPVLPATHQHKESPATPNPILAGRWSHPLRPPPVPYTRPDCGSLRNTVRL